MTIKNLYPTQRPALDLNFANSKRLDPRVSLTRASVGTYVGNDGLIKTAAAGEARFDHNPVTGESLGLLVEESRTNHLSYSTTFAGFSVANATLTTNAGIAPDGTYTAALLTGTGTGNGFITKNVSISAPRTFSYYVKNINAVSARTLNDGERFVFATETFIGNPSNKYFERLPNGWYRLIHFDYSSSSNVNFGIGYPSTDSILIWGPQLEEGPSPTSYIPTEASSVTRAADVASLTNTGVYDTNSFTILNEPYGATAGGSTLNIVGAGQTPVKRTTVYNQELSQSQINTLVKKDDEFWRWRILGSSFALPSFLTDGQVTVDWGDGTVETMTTSEHTFSDGGGYHDVGFRLDSGTYFRVWINNNATYKDKVIALGPAPESMKLDGERGFKACSNLKAVDATIDANGSNSLYETWYNCSSLTSFPLIDTSSVASFQAAWQFCSSLTSFPLLNTSGGTTFLGAWNGCSSLTTFPLIDTSSGTTFQNAWRSCSSLTSFPLLDTSSGTNFASAWLGCSSLTSFPLIDTSNGTFFQETWYSCSSLTTFPLIDTSSGTTFQDTWRSCSSLTSFPLLDTSSGTAFNRAWQNCSSLTSFPLIDTSSGTNFSQAWYNCSSLTSFPLIDTSSATSLTSTWDGCSNLTSFPLISTSLVTSFNQTWDGCDKIASFPLIDTSSGTIFTACWRDNQELTSFPAIDTSSATDFRLSWGNCNKLTSFPLLACSNVQTFDNAWANCSSLTSFPANFFDSWAPSSINNSCFVNAWNGCSSLTATSVENILNSIDTSGQSAPASGVNITIDYDSGTGTPSVSTAVTNLKSRGWTITLNGVAQ